MIIKDHFLTQETFEIKETEISGIWKTHPIPKNISRYYESKDYISHHQDANTIKEKVYKFLQNFNLNYKKKILLENVPKGSKILDYGCGAGEFLKKVEYDFKLYGFEPSETAKNIAKIKTSSIQFISHLEEITDESLEAITLWHVFEHIENQEEILRLFHRKLTARGKLIIAVPNPTSYDAKKYEEFWAAYDVPRHIFHFSKKGMYTLMHTSNWQIKNIKPLLLDAYYISALSEKYNNSPLFWLKGLFFGTISNFKALKTGEFSSLIYIIEKK